MQDMRHPKTHLGGCIAYGSTEYADDLRPSRLLSMGAGKIDLDDLRQHGQKDLAVFRQTRRNL